MGGGFLYTNEIPCRWGWFVVSIICMTQKNRAANAGRFQTTSGRCTADRGRKLVEYSAHVVPEAGINMLPGWSVTAY